MAPKTPPLELVTDHFEIDTPSIVDLEKFAAALLLELAVVGAYDSVDTLYVCTDIDYCSLLL
jgi:hypothetical protein